MPKLAARLVFQLVMSTLGPKSCGDRRHDREHGEAFDIALLPTGTRSAGLSWPHGRSAVRSSPGHVDLALEGDTACSAKAAAMGVLPTSVAPGSAVASLVSRGRWRPASLHSVQEPS